MWHQNNLFFSKSDIVCTVNGLCSAKSPGATIQHLSEKGFSLKSCSECMPIACSYNLMNIMGLTLSVDLLGSFSLGILQQNRSPFSCWGLHNQASILSLEDSFRMLVIFMYILNGMVIYRINTQAWSATLVLRLGLKKYKLCLKQRSMETQIALASHHTDSNTTNQKEVNRSRILSFNGIKRESTIN